MGFLFVGFVCVDFLEDKLFRIIYAHVLAVREYKPAAFMGKKR